MPTMNDDQWEMFLSTLKEQEEKWRQFRDELTTEVREHKRTVNSAINLLGQEAFKFQKDQTEQRDQDRKERQDRQKAVDRKDRMMIGAAGCLIVMNGIALTAIVGVVIYLLTR